MTKEKLSPTLVAYHQNVLAMRQSSRVDFPAHVHLETMAKCDAAYSFCPYPGLDRQGVVMEDALIDKVVNDLCEHVLEIYNMLDFRRLREKLNTRLEADPRRRCGFL